MQRFTVSLLLLFQFMVTVTCSANAYNGERWLLMSRQGECVEMKSLQRKIPDIGDISEPKAFSTFMQGKGYKVITSQKKELKEKVVFVNVPEKELYLIFAKESICKGVLQ